MDERTTEPAPDPRELARLIQSHPAIAPDLRRHWLTLLPQLSPEHRRQLKDVLRGRRGACAG